MSKGMYCSASQWMDSASSSGLICGSEIFLTMTALPETLVATSLVLIFWEVKSRWIASMTAPESMIAPSTIASGGSASIPMLTSWCSAPPLPPDLSSTALTAEDPMSSPTSPFFFPNRPKSASRFLNVGPKQNRDEVRLYRQKLKCWANLTSARRGVKEKMRGRQLSVENHSLSSSQPPPHG